jgi:glycosyltransferase involved in cell wall biosynthesis
MITIGIISFNRKKYLDALIKSIKCLDRNIFNVIVVDNGSWEAGLTDNLKNFEQSKDISKLILRPTSERNWINDEYIAKNIIIEESKDDLIVFLQDDLQFIADQNYLQKLCEDFERTNFQCLEFNGIRRLTNRNKFSSGRFALSPNELKYWVSDKPHFQTMGVFRRKTFQELGPYPTNWPKDRQYWGRSEDYYDVLVKKHYSLINISCHFPAFLGVWNDPRGGYSFIRNDLRYALYEEPTDSTGLYYAQHTFEHIKSLQNTNLPLSYMDVAVPLGWKVAVSADGDQAKYVQNDIVLSEKGKVI